MVRGCVLLGVPSAQPIAKDQVAGDIALEQAELRTGAEWAASGQVGAVVNHQMGVVQPR